MVDLEVLKKYGCSAEDWKKKLQGARHTRGDKVEALIERIRSKIQAGRDFNLQHYQVHYAMDEAWDAAYKQVTPTLLSSLSDKELSRDEILGVLKTWNLDPSEVLQEIKDPKTGQNTVKVNTPAFFRIVVPLVQAYVKIRWAKLVNDRRMIPLLKYDPVVSDDISRLKCDVITSRVESMSRQYGYFELIKQAIFRTLHYAECIKFVTEEWNSVCSIIEDTVAEIPGEPMDAPDGSKVKRIVVKEGLRYHIPHPTRTYYDRAFWPSTINSDTGCTFMGYWRVLRYCDIMNIKGYFNLDTIGFEDFWKWFNGKQSHTYWKNVLSGCALTFPGSTNATENAGGRLDSEKHIADWYSSELSDRPLVISEHFERIIPKDVGLGEYDEPIWARFVVAADDQIIYAAPLPYVPGIWYGYDYVEGRTHGVSMTLEVLPFQDQFTNLLTQLLLTTKQNLANISIIDADILDVEAGKKLEGMGEMFYRGLNILRASFAKLRKQNSNPGDAVISHKLAMGDTNAIIQSMKVVLDTLERVLVMSAQEVGQSASHEQTREEVRHIAQNTSTRVEFTSLGLDSALHAWKKQLYYGLMAYGQPQMWAQVPMEQPMTPEALEKLGFTMAAPYDNKRHKQYLRVNTKTAIAYESFSSDRDGQDRVNDTQTAQAMIMMLDKVLNNPNLFPAVGPEQAIAILNQICRLLDFPRDFKIVNTGQTQTMMDEVKGALEQVVQGSQQQMAELQQDIQGATKAMVEKNGEQDKAIMEVTAKLNMMLSAADQIQLPDTDDQPQDFSVPA